MLEDHPLEERRRDRVRNAARFGHASFGRFDRGHRSVVQQRALPGGRERPQRETHQLALLLEAPAHRRQPPPFALDLRLDGDRAGLRRAQKMHGQGARHPFRIADRLLERPHHQRHHVAAERTARRPPAASHLTLVLSVADRAHRDVVVKAHGGARYSERPQRSPSESQYRAPMDTGFNRRQALATFGSVSLGALLAACGSDGDGNSSTDVSTTDGGTMTVEPKAGSNAATAALFDDSSACTLTAQETEGPYYFDADSIR